MIDLDKVRRETPHVEEVIHLNNAGCSPLPSPVRDAMLNFWHKEDFGAYEAVLENKYDIDQVYEHLSRLIDCSPQDIALTDSGTTAWQFALLALNLRAGDVVLTGECEYSTNLIQLHRLKEERGIHIRVIESDSKGQISLEALRGAISERTALIALTHIPTNCGLVNPAAEVGKIAKAAGVPYLLDAVQSIGQLPVSVREIGCDFLAATGRKFLRGPRGTGFLYVGEEIRQKIKPYLLDNHGGDFELNAAGEGSIVIRRDARQFERYESNYGLTQGLGSAAKYALDLGIPNIWRRVGELAGKLRLALANMDGVNTHDIGEELCGIVAFTVSSREPDEVKLALRRQNINVSVSEASSTPYDMQRRKLSNVVRASVHYFNTEEEIERVVGHVATLRGSKP